MSDASTDIAIVGMAVRVPGARTIEEFWRNLRSGVESIRTLTEDELRAAGESDENLRDSHYVPRAADLEGMEQFDAGFFGFGRQEAAVMDPQHRQFLECAWEAIESAARPPSSLGGPVAVFAGCGMGSYFYFNICSNKDLVDRTGMFLLRHTGNDKDFLSTRLSHILDLHGPSVNVQTACSTSLVAVHYACQSLLSGESDMAIAGGVTIELPHRRGYIYRDGEILSPDGHCRAFDHRAAGTVFGSGAGVVVLRRLADALKDGDPIRAVIKATAINNDGAGKASYLAPSVTGQSEAVLEAQTLAGISADTVQYVECHGTGTRLGDPIELEALTQAFRHTTDKKRFCRVGSVKSNIGHLDTAAGVVSLIKTALAIEHGEIPPTLGYERPNPAIDFDNSPFVVCDRLTPWPKLSGPRRAGVNSLGVGGTNAHAILEQAPLRAAASEQAPRPGPHLLVLSAKTRKALDARCDQLATFMDGPKGPELSDIAATLFHGRTHFSHRRVVVAGDRSEAVSGLRSGDRLFPAHTVVDGAKDAVFLFPGGGAQYPSMGRSLYRQEPVFRRVVDEGLGCLPADVASEIRTVWLGSTSEASKKFLDPALQLPAILIIEVALVRLWESWGVKPAALIGHSMGENTAACVAGVLTYRNAVELVHLRGQLFNEIPPGGMLSVPIAEAALRARLPEGIDVASVNGPEMAVVSGDNPALEKFQNELAIEGIEAIRVPIDIAAHSRMLAPILDRFEAFLASLKLSAPRIPIVSNLTGTWLTSEEACDPAYWRAHLRSTIRFADGLVLLSKDPGRVYIEVGPGRALSSLAKAHGAVHRNQVINSLPHPDEALDDRQHLYGALGRVWAAGLPVDLGRFCAKSGSPPVKLPTYPFQHETYWIAPGAESVKRGASSLKHASIDDWFASTTWVRSPRVTRPRDTAKEVTTRRWLVYSDGSPLARRLAKALSATVVETRSRADLKSLGGGRWTLDATAPSQHQMLIDELDKVGLRPTDVVYCHGLAPSLPKLRATGATGDLDAALDDSFFVPVSILQALGRLGDDITFNVVTSGLAQILNEPIDPVRSALVGPVLVAPREMPQISTRCFDVRRGISGQISRRSEGLLIEELATPPGDRVVALRGPTRWVRSTIDIKLEPAADPTEWLREDGVYVVTGGLGGIALEIAERLARSKKIRLALLSRGALPPDAEWDAALGTIAPTRIGASRMRRIRAVRALGSVVAVYACDITNAASLESTLAQVRADLGPLTGVFHTAGVMDDAPIENKSKPSMKQVLAPKVAGAINLDRAIHEPLDVFVVFSSIASLLGLPGQVDYTAANAVLDAFAIERSGRAAGRTVVINWSAWRDVGMAARASVEQRHGRVPSSVTSHPALDGYSDEHGVGRVFVTDFSVGRHWLLSEHRIRNGMALLSGTTFVELARAAFCVGRAPAPIEISDLTFLTPFQVAADATRRLVLQLSVQGRASEVTIRTAGDDPRSAPHVIGDIALYHGEVPAAVDVKDIRRRCSRRVKPLRGGIDEQRLVDFGPRWDCVREIAYGDGEALLELAIAAEFEGDLEHYQLHPALLDFATGGAQRLIPEFDPETDFYIPVAYGRLRLFERMPPRFFSHVRLRPGTTRDEVSFDVTLVHEDGNPFCQIEGFEMKRVDAISGIVAPKGHAPAIRTGDTALERLMRDAIAPKEGLEALDRIMSNPGLVQCIASSMDLDAWQRSLAAEGRGQTSSDSDTAGSFSRPDLDSAFAAPESETELQLARTWSGLLGIRRIGVDDDFFQLGGHSLHAVRLFADIRRAHKVSLPISTLFEHPSIRRLAAFLDAQASPSLPGDNAVESDGPAATSTASLSQYSSVVAIQALGTAPPFYCAAGMGGNPLNLRALALEMGVDQPFFALQPRGLDGETDLHRTVPEMATHYISEMRARQPEGPYYLGGYSGGGVVAFEMAKQLTAAGERVGALVLLDSVAPGVTIPSMTAKLGNHAAQARQGGVRYVAKALRHAGTRRAKLVAQLARKPLRRLFPYHYRIENIADTWTEAFAAYQPSPYEGDAILYRANSGFVMGVDIGRSNGWDRLIGRELEIVDSPGDHASMCEPPHVGVLARRLRAWLRRRYRLETLGAPPPAKPRTAQRVDAGLSV